MALLHSTWLESLQETGVQTLHDGLWCLMTTLCLSNLAWLGWIKPSSPSDWWDGQCQAERSRISVLYSCNSRPQGRGGLVQPEGWGGSARGSCHAWHRWATAPNQHLVSTVVWSHTSYSDVSQPLCTTPPVCLTLTRKHKPYIHNTYFIHEIPISGKSLLQHSG